MELLGRRYDTGDPVRLTIEDGRIVRVESLADSPAAQRGWPWIAPGLIDIQVNGYGGQDFSSPRLTTQHVAEIADSLARSGVTQFCPTLTTQSNEVLKHGLCTIRAAREGSRELAQRIPGIHVEGPYITPQDGARGAHPLAHCRPPSWDEFQQLQEAAGGQIRILTMSVDFDGSPAFIERVVASGVVVAVGHTAATADQIRAAADAGARLSTHLGNGSHQILARHPNYIWAQLAEDRMVASMIVDGHHLPADVVKTFVRAKTPQRCILISDLAGLAGLPPGRYSSALSDSEILEDGRLVVAGQRKILAGASRPISVGVGNVMHFAGVGLPEAIRMATTQPAALLGIESSDLRPGDSADLVLFDLAEPATVNGPARMETRAALGRGVLIAGSL